MAEDRYGPPPRQQRAGRDPGPVDEMGLIAAAPTPASRRRPRAHRGHLARQEATLDLCRYWKGTRTRAHTAPRETCPPSLTCSHAPPHTASSLLSCSHFQIPRCAQGLPPPPRAAGPGDTKVLTQQIPAVPGACTPQPLSSWTPYSKGTSVLT